MKISDLDKDELTALAGLIKIIILADRNVSRGEQKKLDALIRDFGENDFRDHLDLFNGKCTDMDSFRSFLLSIESMNTREMIYRILFDLATSDSVYPVESEVLEWLSAQWELDIGIFFNEGNDNLTA